MTKVVVDGIQCLLQDEVMNVWMVIKIINAKMKPQSCGVQIIIMMDAAHNCVV
ncbi:hypothetical protein KDU71_13190 [Carboxylicivirga sediminis]|uniref:Uncharacterized protein n=1 Tax=Carboxylicivirga sediminis TaxID=2006564 RepID=A0A941F522_9BACT|nr:hypothetical protein [Carboxylicivirga sediminis]MBR8536522.1 hypothetical protein [Carboxylicivirga sediminis]